MAVGEWLLWQVDPARSLDALHSDGEEPVSTVSLVERLELRGETSGQHVNAMECFIKCTSEVSFPKTITRLQASNAKL